MSIVDVLEVVLRIVLVVAAFLVLPLLVAVAAGAVTMAVTAELASPFLTSVAAGIVCLAAIACVLLLRPDLLRQAKALRSAPPAATATEVAEAVEA